MVKLYRGRCVGGKVRLLCIILLITTVLALITHSVYEGSRIPNQAVFTIDKSILPLKKYDYIKGYLDDDLMDVRIRLLSNTGGRAASVLLTPIVPVVVEKNIGVGGGEVKVKFVLWGSIEALVDLDRGSLHGTLDLPNPSMTRSLKLILENRELSEILLREPWYVFLPGYSSVKSVVNRVLIMFEKPVWINKTINNVEVLGWISSIAIHLDEEENAIKWVDVNFGHPEFKVSLNDIVFKRAEDLARVYIAKNTGRWGEVLFVGRRLDLLIFTSSIEGDREFIVVVNTTSGRVDESRSGVVVKAPATLTCPKKTTRSARPPYSATPGVVEIMATQTPPSSKLKLLSMAEDKFYNFDFSRRNVSGSTMDQPITILFWYNANVNKVKGIYRRPYLPGSTRYFYLYDNPRIGWQWDSDRGIKYITYLGAVETCPGVVVNFGYVFVHMRIYANPLTDRNYNRFWGYYVLASTHLDEFPTESWWGYQEIAERLFIEWASSRGYQVHYNSLYFYNDALDGCYIRNPYSYPNTTIWCNNGYISTVKVH
jgi:hypothetical protein